jgi:hypothetical protein
VPKYLLIIFAFDGDSTITNDFAIIVKHPNRVNLILATQFQKLQVSECSEAVSHCQAQGHPILEIDAKVSGQGQSIFAGKQAAAGRKKVIPG